MLTGHGNMGMRAEQAGVGTEKEGGGWYTSGGDEGVGDERGREGGVRVADLQTESGWGGGEPRDYDVDWRHDGGVGDGVEITAGWFSGVSVSTGRLLEELRALDCVHGMGNGGG